MRKSVLKRPSPALAVAFVALLVALGGTSLFGGVGTIIGSAIAFRLGAQPDR